MHLHGQTDWHIWLGGDFNLCGINWENGSIRPKARNTKQCKQLLDISHDHALEQMVSKHTYITESSQSTMDLFFANNSTPIDQGFQSFL